MQIVRALGDTDFRLSDWVKVAMFAGQEYEVPDEEAERLIAAGLAMSARPADGEREEPQEGSPAPSLSAPRRRRKELPNA